MFGVQTKVIVAVAALLMPRLRADAATLVVQPINLVAGEVGMVFVEGSAVNEVTIGVNVLVELVPRVGSVGTVTFSPAPPTDIALTGDPWPGVGVFTPLDTDQSGSLLLNGAVKDNGTFVPALVTYSGPLVGFPVVASANASGTWDVVLATSSGPSNWEGLATTLTPATITLVGTGAIPAASSWALAILFLSILAAGIVQVSRRRRVFTD